MHTLMKPVMVLGLAGAMALGAMTSSEARVRPWVAGAAGFAVGTAIGAAVANNAYYGPRAYAYDYAPGYGDYAYEPAYGYSGYSGHATTNRPRWEERRLDGIE